MNIAQSAVRNAFDGRRRLRGWENVHFGGMDAVKAHPISMCRFRPDEGGTVSTNLNIKLAPVSGYMRSKAYVDVVQVFVPYQAIEKLWLEDTNEDAGVTEMTRRRLLSGVSLPALSGTTDISKACYIHPRRVGDDYRLSSSIHRAYNCAVNHLRKLLHHEAEQVGDEEYDIQPAVLSATVLDRFNGVLDPERNIDGSINLSGDVPVKGIAVGTGNPFQHPNRTVNETDEEGAIYENAAKAANAADLDGIYLEEDPSNPGSPRVVANLDGTSEITLRDMIQSQKLDGLIRQFARMIDIDPVNGEELVERALYNISVDFDANCHVMHRRVHELSATHVRPTDGASINDVSAHFELQTNFATVVPRSELGGQLVTIVMVKPLETLEAQPDPAQTEAWELVNRIHDETELDEVLLTRADLESNVSAADADTPVFWVGHNSLKHDYSTRGPNVHQIAGVEMKSSMWTYPVPTSVTPENVNYPADGISMYPFFNWNGKHAEYTVSQVAAISTSLAKGPNPVERIKLFAEDPSLIDDGSDRPQFPKN